MQTNHYIGEIKNNFFHAKSHFTNYALQSNEEMPWRLADIEEILLSACSLDFSMNDKSIGGF